MNLRKIIARLGFLALALSSSLCFGAVASAGATSHNGGATATVAATVNAGATITFRKVFKSSYPEFVEIKVTDAGSGTYDIRQLDEDASPQPLELGQGLVQRIFQLAEQLHDFQGVDLEVHRRIANLGQKTFRYEKGSDAHEVTFNYTLNEAAAQLLDIFEGIAREQTDVSDLRRTMRYDRLGVNDVLIQVDSDYSKKLLPEPSALLPTLDAIASDEKIIDIARERARTLASKIRGSH